MTDDVNKKVNEMNKNDAKNKQFKKEIIENEKRKSELEQQVKEMEE